MQLKSRFIKNLILLTFSTAIINIVEMITNVYITNKIGTTVLGSFSLITNLFNFLVTISLFGIPLAITKIVSESDILSENSTISYSTKIGCKFCGLISVIVCIFSIIFKDKISKIFLNGIVDTHTIIILSLSLPFIAITSCFCAYFNALRKVEKPIITEFLTHIVKSSLIVALLYIKFPTYKTLAISILLSELISFIFSYMLCRKDIKVYKSNEKIDKKSTIFHIFKISVPISFTSFIRSGLSTIKHTLIPLRMQKYGYSYEYSLSRYGLIHGIALPFILMPSIFINSFASLLLPEYSRYFASKNITRIQEITEKIFKTTIILSLYISFVIYLSSDLVCFKLYNNHEVSYYVKILTPLICIIYLDYIVDSMLKGLDLQVNVMKINIIDLIISITLIYFGIPYLGSFGYILVIYVSEYINGLMSINELLKASSIQFKYFEWLVKPLICFFSAYAIINLINISVTNFCTLLFSVLLFTIITFVLIFLSKTITLNKKKEY